MHIVYYRNTQEVCGDGCCSFPSGCYLTIELDNNVLLDDESIHWMYSDDDVRSFFKGTEWEEIVNSATIVEI